jgi:hypothetical protein
MFQKPLNKAVVAGMSLFLAKTNSSGKGNSIFEKP